MNEDPRFSKASIDKRFIPLQSKNKKLPLDERFNLLNNLSFHRLGRENVHGFRDCLHAKREFNEFQSHYQVTQDAATQNSKKKNFPKLHDRLENQKKASFGRKRASTNSDNENTSGELVESEYSVNNVTDSDSEEDSVDSFDYDELLRIIEQNKNSHVVSEDDSSVEFSSDSDLDYESDDDQITAEADEVSNDIQSSRLAIVDLEWDSITAQDLLVVSSSFVPEGGSIKSVVIYYSDYGLEKHEREYKYGPEFYDELVTGGSVDLNSDFQKKIRKFYLNRKRYYFAVVECDKFETAWSVYKNLDENELESMTVKMNVKFIPDTMDFSGRREKDRAEEIQSDYEPSQFISALCKTKVKFKFDETPSRHSKLLSKPLSLSEQQLSCVIASPSDSDESGSEKEKSTLMYKSLIQQLDQAQEELVKSKDEFIEYGEELAIPEAVEEMIEDGGGKQNLVKTWKRKCREEKAARQSKRLSKSAVERNNLIQKSTTTLGEHDSDANEAGYDESIQNQKPSELVADYAEGGEDVWKDFESQFSKTNMKKSKKRYLEQLRAEKAAECKKLSLLVDETDADDRDDAYNNEIHSKNLTKDDEDLQVDERFESVLFDPRFAPDPTHPQYSKSTGSKIIKARKLYRDKNVKRDSVEMPKQGFFDAQSNLRDNFDIRSIVASVKSKVKSK